MLILLILISYLTSRRKPVLKSVVPLMSGLISIIGIVVSLFIGAWTGMAIGIISLTALIASLASLILIKVIETIRKN
ncbi:YesK family protein [Priestia endophytica]|uniref:YesK family protein n=1 Tax=Priestia endophytica TaxID=135735 RepID=UPI001CEF5BA4|nr:YesK family protein [Priestia endophytica]